MKNTFEIEIENWTNSDIENWNTIDFEGCFTIDIKDWKLPKLDWELKELKLFNVK